ncbi:siderophore-interacting protein [Gordonia sp. NB41Y]|uniref:siderophore-interacting protein n=1 Tax=Gordonia sp. NB41Y TaxID=875808 RepID=UPI0002BEDD5F|nr:siderophore-interacting protein [Gordonia sp. NB41Y]EMP15026.1 siderophore esterase [Gordonia sp. NB41Y]WLP92413.1 siderophore-interacting protein [Gordonia sp. NB41Y]
MGPITATVAGTESISAHLRRLYFDVPDLSGLALPGMPDEAVGMYVPTPDGPNPTEGRNYSIRHVDHEARTLAVDVVLHEHGPVTEWAAGATAGDRVEMSHARGWFAPPAGTGWLLLATDLAGLPAAARILEELRAQHDPVQILVLAEVVDDADLAYLGQVAPAEVVPIIGSGNGVSPSRLGTAVTEVGLPDGPGYCWFAGEAAQSRIVRKHLRHQLHWPSNRYDAIGYWRFDGERWAQRFAQYGDELFAVYQNAIDAGRSEKQAAEEFDEALEKLGL